MSYVNNVDGSIDVTNAIGAIESIVTNGNVTTVSATAQVKTSNVIGKLGVGQIVEKDYEKLENLPSINGIILKGNKTTEDLGIVGTSMTEIEVSTDPENPTDISVYFDKSGTYVAKNTGIIMVLDELITPIAKGGFFTVQNFKDDASKLGEEVPDEYNILMVSLTIYNSDIAEEIVLKRIGIDDWYAAIKLTTENASNYLDLDIDVTSEVQQGLKNSVNSSYGMQLIGDYLSFISASTSDIDYANTPYRVITPSNIKYAIQKWGTEYFATKEQQEILESNITTLQNDLTTLKTEIETILESVVVVDE